MQARLEDVLGEKERELKLHQRFLDLKSLCEQDVFPTVNIPLKQHTEELTSLMERIIPDPRDRKEEMFSGEIFALLGAAYLHDAGLAGNCRWLRKEEMLGELDMSHKRMLVSGGIAMELGIPEKAIDVINYICSSNTAKKIPMEWVITEAGKKALIRNTKVIEHLFNFSHFILDVFCPHPGHSGLRRLERPGLVLGDKRVSLEISSREGVITVHCEAASPYELHQIEKARPYVDNAFELFRNNVNGRLGFQYKQIKWDIARVFDDRAFGGGHIFSPCAGGETPLLERWQEAAAVLDKVFEYGCAVLVGKESVGKSTLLNSFVLSQAANIFANAFCCEIWTNPVRELKNRICDARSSYDFPDLDIISLCSKLIDEGPCLFVLDGFERTDGLDPQEREKLERFLDFCFAREDCYLVISGDRNAFFDWSGLLRGTGISVLYELKPLECKRAAAFYGHTKVSWDESSHYTPAECQLLVRGLNIDDALRRLLEDTADVDQLRALLAALMDMNEMHLKRHSIEDLCFETHLPQVTVFQHLDLLSSKGLIARDDVFGSPLYSLAGLYLREPLYRILDLGQFADKKTARELLRHASLHDTLLDRGQLELVRQWKDAMVFSKEGMGRILAGLTALGEDCRAFLEKAKSDNSGIDIQPILKLIRSDDRATRERAIGLLLNVGGKNVVNPLLRHLKDESVPELKDLIVKGMWNTGKRRRIIAVMRALKENGDRDSRLKALEFFHGLSLKTAQSLLADLVEIEDDPIILQELGKLSF